MAAFFRDPAPSHQPPRPIQLVSRQWDTYDWQVIEVEQRQLHSRSRRRDVERRREKAERRSPPRNRNRRQQLHTPLSTPNSSTPCLIALPGSELPFGVGMERTPSGNSIVSEPLYEFEGPLQTQPQYDPLPYPQDLNTTSQNLNYTFASITPPLLANKLSSSIPISIPISTPSPSNAFTPCTDHEAALSVATHLRRHPSHSKHARILRSIISSASPSPPDDATLSSILTSADALFFHSSLRGRVRFEWSSEARYHHDLIGTTALRRAAQGGFETLVVLSEPILKHEAYDRRLLISAFLHELVHCYLFIRCGFEAREGGGHTPGFMYIVGRIAEWIGEGDELRLGCVRANLNEFRKKPIKEKGHRDKMGGTTQDGDLTGWQSGAHADCTHQYGGAQEMGWELLDDRVGMSGWR